MSELSSNLGGNLGSTSDLSEQSQSAPRDPSNYAPRWLRENREQRSTLAGEPRAMREARREPAARSFPRTPSLDQQLENAVFESLRHSLDPEVMPTPPGFGSGIAQRLMAGFAGRLALAVGVSAVIALLLVIVLPAIRQQTVSSSLASTLENSTAAISRMNRPEDGSKPALAEFRGLLATPGEANESTAPRQSGQMLQQFLVWREKANPNDPPQ